MPSITLKDRDEDQLYVRSTPYPGALLEIESEDEESYFVFKEAQRDELVKLRDLLNGVLGDFGKPEASATASEISLNESLMRLAAIHGRTVKFRYAKGDGDVIETRKLVPHEVQKKVNGTTLFVGQDPDRDDEFRAYRVDRIKGEAVIVGPR